MQELIKESITSGSGLMDENLGALLALHFYSV